LGDDLLPLTSSAAERWIRVTSLIGMLHATREARAAMILITVSKNMEMRELAEAVHALRMTLGIRVRIVIREIGTSLRYHNELLLLQLGANIVIHRNVALARIPLILQSLHGQSYRQKRQIGFEDAVESVTPSKSKGYLSPFYFHEEVQTVLREAQALSVPCAMVLLEHSADLNAQDALQRFQLSRMGDLLTATSRHCYLFLYGCPAQNVPEVLSRLLGAYATQELENAECHTDTAAIAAVLVQLRQCATAGSMSDLSADWADFSFHANACPVKCEDNAANSSALIDSSMLPLQATPLEIIAAPSEAIPLPAMPSTAEVVIPFYRDPAPRARRRYG
jgi:cellulose biosynthesis protein BcsE